MIKTVNDLPLPDREILEKYQLLFIERLRVSALKENAIPHRDDGYALESVLCGVETLFLYLNDPNTEKPNQPFWNTSFIFGHLCRPAFNNLQAWQYMLSYIVEPNIKLFDPYLQAFFKAWCMLSTPYKDYLKAVNNNSPIYNDGTHSISHNDLYRYFISALKTVSSSEGFQQSITDWENTKKEESAKILKYVSNCLDTCSPLRVTRIQLFYDESGKEARTPQCILQELVNALEKRLLPNNIVGFIASLDVEHSIQLSLLQDPKISSPSDKNNFSISTIWGKIITGGRGYLREVHETIELHEAKPGSPIGFAIFSKWALKPPQGCVFFDYITKAESPTNLSSFINQMNTNHASKFLLLQNRGHISFGTIKPPQSAVSTIHLINIIKYLVSDTSDKKRLKALETVFDDLSLNQGEYVSELNFYNNSTLYVKPHLSLIAAIEAFMVAVKYDARDAYEIVTRSGIPEWTANPLGKYLSNIGSLEAILYRMNLFYGQCNIQFSTRVNTFFWALSYALNRRPPGAPIGTPDSKMFEGSQVVLCNYFIKELREYIQIPAIKKNVYTNIYNTDKKYELACKYFSYLLRKHGDLTILAMDLFLNRPDLAPNNQAKAASNFLSQYLKKSKGAEILSYCVGHMGRWEYAETKELYVRIIFFFEAKKLSPEKRAALSGYIDHYWVTNITDNKGTTLPAKLSSHPLLHEQYTIQIRPSDKPLVTAFKESVIAYLTQSTLYIREGSIRHRNIFLRGEFPTNTRKKRTSSTDESA